ncbi:hypothetical protein D3C80_1392170 [compost metagenome]
MQGAVDGAAEAVRREVAEALPAAVAETQGDADADQPPLDMTQGLADDLGQNRVGVFEVIGVHPRLERGEDQFAEGGAAAPQGVGPQAQGQIGNRRARGAERAIPHAQPASAGAEVSSARACSSPPIWPFSAP